MKKPLQTQPRSWQWGTDVLAAADSGSVPVLETVFIDAASRAPSLWVLHYCVPSRILFFDMF
jgi:hypothetical protein